MHRSAIVVALCVVIVVVMAVGGCAKAKEAAQTAKNVGKAAKFAADMQDGKAKIKTDEGEVEVQQNDKDENVTMSFKGDDGEEFTVTGGENIDLTGLEIAVYPGATAAGGHTSTSNDGDTITAAFTSDDPFDKIASFYKDKYSDAGKHEMTMENTKMLMLTIGEDPKVKTVTVTESPEDEGVQIVLQQHIAKDKPAE